MKIKLTNLLESQKSYLLPELTLNQLAKLSGTNISVLSKVINEGFGMNFNELINQYRVNDVIQSIALNHHTTKTLLGIAFDCGFNSKATFNRAFKKQTGQTPKAYINGSKFRSNA